MKKKILSFFFLQLGRRLSPPLHNPVVFSLIDSELFFLPSNWPPPTLLLIFLSITNQAGKKNITTTTTIRQRKYLQHALFFQSNSSRAEL